MTTPEIAPAPLSVPTPEEALQMYRYQ